MFSISTIMILGTDVVALMGSAVESTAGSSASPQPTTISAPRHREATLFMPETRAGRVPCPRAHALRQEALKDRPRRAAIREIAASDRGRAILALAKNV